MVLTKWGFFFLEARHVVNKVLLISLFQKCNGVNKMFFFFFFFFFLEARHVVNKVLLISLFQKCNGVNKMGLLFWRHVMLSTKCC